MDDYLAVANSTAMWVLALVLAVLYSLHLWEA